MRNFVKIKSSRKISQSAVFAQNGRFSQKQFQGYHQSVKQFESRSGPSIVASGLGPNCLQRILEGGTSRRTVKLMTFREYLSHSYARTLQSCEYCKIILAKKVKFTILDENNNSNLLNLLIFQIKA